MGSHAQDSSTQKTASAGATAQDQQLAQNAAQNQQYSNTTRQNLFGTYNPTSGTYSGGTVSSFLNPQNLNPTQLSGSYKAAYNTAADQNAKTAQNAVSTTLENMNSRGMGKTPAGFAANQQREAYQTQAGTNGQNFSGLLTQQQQEALNNYWNATNMLNANSTNTANLAVQGNQAAAGNYANLYGTASQQVQNGWAVAGQTLAGMGQAAATAYAGR